MIRSARRRHLLIWLVLGPVLLIGLAAGVMNRPAEAISSGPVPIAGDPAVSKSAVRP